MRQTMTASNSQFPSCYS